MRNRAKATAVVALRICGDGGVRGATELLPILAPASGRLPAAAPNAAAAAAPRRVGTGRFSRRYYFSYPDRPLHLLFGGPGGPHRFHINLALGPTSDEPAARRDCTVALRSATAAATTVPDTAVGGRRSRGEGGGVGSSGGSGGRGHVPGVREGKSGGGGAGCGGTAEEGRRFPPQEEILAAPSRCELSLLCFGFEWR